MKSEDEILVKYDEMLGNTKRLHDIVQNPPDGYSIVDIEEAIVDENSQHSMNALMEWVLGYKNK